jgi:hypothetical protein
MTERQPISPGSPYEPLIGFSRAVRVGDTVYSQGQSRGRRRQACLTAPGYRMARERDRRQLTRIPGRPLGHDMPDAMPRIPPLARRL